MKSTTTSLLAALTLATGIAVTTGCTAPAPEGLGSNSSKLLAPQAVFKGPATADTKRVLGISEWRIYRGKTEYIVTGYNDAGKAVKGVGFSFAGATHSAKAKITGRVLDGSHASGVHEYGGNTSSPSLKNLSQTFVDHAFHDLTMLRMGLKTSITRSAVRSGEACSGDLTKIVMSSLQCITNAKATGSSVSKAIKVKQCVAAASSASKAVASCQNVGTTAAPAAKAPASPAAPSAPAKAPAAAAPKAPAASSGSTKSAETPAKDPATAKQDAEDAKKEAADKKTDAKTDGTEEAKKEAEKPPADPAKTTDPNDPNKPADPTTTDPNDPNKPADPTTTDPNDPNKPADPTTTDPNDPNKPADPTTDPNDPNKPADPSTDPSTTPADPSADPTTTPGNDAGNTVPQDTQVADATTGADAATTASGDQTCTSCNGTAATDVQANDTTGDVSAANDSAPSDPAPAQDSAPQEPVDTAGEASGDTSAA